MRIDLLVPPKYPALASRSAITRSALKETVICGAFLSGPWGPEKVMAASVDFVLDAFEYEIFLADYSDALYELNKPQEWSLANLI